MVKPVKLSFLSVKQMHQKIAKIQQNPSAAAVALAVVQLYALLKQLRL